MGAHHQPCQQSSKAPQTHWQTFIYCTGGCCTVDWNTSIVRENMQKTWNGMSLNKFRFGGKSSLKKHMEAWATKIQGHLKENIWTWLSLGGGRTAGGNQWQWHQMWNKNNFCSSNQHKITDLMPIHIQADSKSKELRHIKNPSKIGQQGGSTQAMAPSASSTLRKQRQLRWQRVEHCLAWYRGWFSLPKILCNSKE